MTSFRVNFVEQTFYYGVPGSRSESDSSEPESDSESESDDSEEDDDSAGAAVATTRSGAMQRDVGAMRCRSDAAHGGGGLIYEFKLS